MRKIALFGLVVFTLVGCQDEEDIRGIPVPQEVEARLENREISLKEEAEQLRSEGYETFIMEEEDTSYLMQQYFMVFLKSGPNRSQDSLTAAQLQEKHMDHLGRMATEGYASLIGPFGDDGEIRGIVVFNTPTLEMADSLANLDPMVQAGRLEVEVHPWWTAKGGSLK